jgi:ABC-type lipoprotein export system ATPase subunit
MALLQALNHEGTTIVIVTHEADIAGYAKRLIRFLDGRVQSDSRQKQADAADVLGSSHRELAGAAA